jgi:hypothetical protein
MPSIPTYTPVPAPHQQHQQQMHNQQQQRALNINATAFNPTQSFNPNFHNEVATASNATSSNSGVTSNDINAIGERVDAYGSTMASILNQLQGLTEQQRCSTQ